MIKSTHLLFSILSLFFFYGLAAQQKDKILIHFDEKKTYQTISNFGASDAWACQFVGNWPAAKKIAIADWLFTRDTLLNGNPKGIGLSLWRYNIGAGSAEQNDKSGIKDEWRRTALITDTNKTESKKVQAQNWFLQAAKQSGVQQFLGFFNSPPVQLTKNKKAYADKGICNIDSINYKAFADYAVNAIKQIKKSTGITFNYISPVNEPQWDWSNGAQEGCPYTNKEISELVKTFNKAFQQNKLNTKLLVAEAGHLKYLLSADDKKDKDDEINDFFNTSSTNYIGNLPCVSHTIASHGYFTTSPFSYAMQLRTQVKDAIAQKQNLDFWQTEYCILGNNAGEINGNKKDTGMAPALYLAKVIYEDMVAANASAWQWWTAISAYDYKDGLIYIDKSKTDGNFSDSKMLWALGNYSRFILPGMQRIKVDVTSTNLLVSGYEEIKKGMLVLVFVNEERTQKPILLDDVETSSSKAIITYTTNATKNLDKKIIKADELIIPPESVVTVLIN
jgi:hypothetical protein